MNDGGRPSRNCAICGILSLKVATRKQTTTCDPRKATSRPPEGSTSASPAGKIGSGGFLAHIVSLERIGVFKQLCSFLECLAITKKQICRQPHAGAVRSNRTMCRMIVGRRRTVMEVPKKRRATYRLQSLGPGVAALLLLAMLAAGNVGVVGGFLGGHCDGFVGFWDVREVQ